MRGSLRGFWSREYPLRDLARAYKNVQANGHLHYVRVTVNKEPCIVASNSNAVRE